QPGDEVLEKTREFHGPGGAPAASPEPAVGIDLDPASWLDDWGGPTAPAGDTASRQAFDTEPTRDLGNMSRGATSNVFAQLSLDDLELDDDALDGGWPDDPESIERRLVDELDLGAPAGESPGDRERRRVSALI